MAGEGVVAAHAHAPAVLARALGVLDELVAQDAHRVVVLGLLDGGVLRVLEVGLHGVHAVGAQGGAVAAGDGLVVGEVLPVVRAAAAEGQVADDALAAGRHPLRHGRCQGLEHQVAQVHRHLPARRHRRRVAGVDDRAGPGADVHQAVQPVVDGNVRVDQALEHVDDGRVGLRVGGVGGGLALRVGLAQVHGHVFAVHGYRHPEAQLLVADPVAVHPRFGRVAAVRESGELGPHAALRVVQQPLHVRGQLPRAVLFHQLAQAAHPQAVGGGLGAEVAGDLVHAAEVGADDLEHALVDHAVAHEAHGRDDEALLVDLAGHPDAARRAAAHVHVVGDVGHKTEQLSVVKHGRDQCDVVEVHTAGERVVAEQHVPRLQPVAPVARGCRGHDVGQRAQVRGLREGLRHRPAAGVEEGAGKVPPRLDVGGVRRPAQRGAHLLGHRQQGVADHLEAHRLQAGAEDGA